ncbi:hypothetical protein SEVIR_8G051401v4 [Setaria viridis]|uniref:Uncharacterized protein n=1 Tax=Setaria viridis TaxID=4556 RepID=A0A4U6TPV8_SETVI|nr:hypothetical protein SEVIR_8G051401v2 [Setaria viridis]
MASGSPTTTLKLTITIAGVACALLLLAAGAAPPPALSRDFEDDKVHEFLRVLDQAAAYRRECFGECAKGCYCSDNPYSCLRECMPTPPTRRCGATYGTVQGLFSSSATFAAYTTPEEGGRVSGDGAAAGEGGFSGAT